MDGMNELTVYSCGTDDDPAITPPRNYHRSIGALRVGDMFSQQDYEDRKRKLQKKKATPRPRAERWTANAVDLYHPHGVKEVEGRAAARRRLSQPLPSMLRTGGVERVNPLFTHPHDAENYAERMRIVIGGYPPRRFGTYGTRAGTC